MTKKQETKKEKIKIEEIYDKNKAYPAIEAFEIIKKINKAKFDASVEMHIRLGIDPKKGDQQIRGAINLPHGTGKTIKIAAFVSPENEKIVKQAGADLVGGDDLINEIKEKEKTDFDVAIAEPVMMKNLAKIAKILGTRGLMPSPKNETVSNEPAKIVEELKKGKISFKNDDTANLHLLIGKISFTNDQLIENYQNILRAIKKLKPASSKGIFIRNISLCSSMSPAVKIAID
jgi:large subunit ribosomal protein L1